MTLHCQSTCTEKSYVCNNKLRNRNQVRFPSAKPAAAVRDMWFRNAPPMQNLLTSDISRCLIMPRNGLESLIYSLDSAKFQIRNCFKNGGDGGRGL